MRGQPVVTVVTLLWLAIACLASAAGPLIPPGILPSGPAVPQTPDFNQLFPQYGLTPPALGSGASVPESPDRGDKTDQAPRREAELPVSTLDAFRAVVRTGLREGALDPEKRRLLEMWAAEQGIPRDTAQNEMKRLEEEDRRIQEYLGRQIQSLSRKGEILPEDRRFLDLRAQDLGLAPREAREHVDRALDHQRKLAVYRSVLGAFVEDGILDASEEKHLERKRKELSVSDEEGEKLLAEIRKEGKEPAKDVLADIRKRDTEKADLPQQLELYGREIFRTQGEAFDAAAGMPPPDTYLVGPGDRFQVSLWGRMEADYTLTVDREGRVSFPRVGPVKVGGLTYAEARARLIQRAEAITGVSAAVTLARMRSVQVFVVGEAERPGLATLSPLATVVQAVAAAGGPTPLGSLRTVSLKRSGKEVGAVDFYDFLQRGEAPGDRPLQPGDVVVVPKAEKLVKLIGKVRRQAVYELRGQEGIRALLDFAGGLSADASGGRLQVERTQKNQVRTVLDVSLQELKGDFELQDGDVVRVFPLETELANTAALYGHAHQPGIRAFAAGMRVADLIGSAENLKPEVDLSYAVVLRESGADRAKTVIPFRLGDALSDPRSVENLPLLPRDEVYVFPRDQFRPPLQVKVSGEVRAPGAYRFPAGARVADVLRLAGGATPEASLTQGELLRVLPDRSRETRYVSLEKALAGEPEHNLTMADRDELIVHPLPHRQVPEVVVVEGEVYGVQSQDPALKKPSPGRGRTAKEQLSDLQAWESGAQTGQERPGDLPSGKDDPRRPRDKGPSREVALARGDSPDAPSLRKPTLDVPLTRGMRIRDLVFKAGGLTKAAYLPVAHLYRTDRLTHEVSIVTFDLGLALGGEPGENVELQDLDHVVIHSATEFVPVQRVVVSGMVNQPGEYPYASNMRIRDLVVAAGGLQDQAYLAEAEVVRSEIVDGRSSDTRTLRFTLDKALAGDPEANLPLKPYDKVLVKRIPEWKDSRTVEIRGEVPFAGIYYIAKGEKLSSVLHRAGGYAADAYPAGAVFTRESVREQQQKRLEELRDRLQQAILRASSQEAQTALSAEDLAAQKQYVAAQEALMGKLEAARATGRVVLKLLPLAELEGSEWDVVLEDGDALTIPKKPQTVSVLGQVYNPTTLLWEPDRRTVAHYLAKTGGPTSDAEKSEMYVVRADGSVVSKQSLKAQSWWSKSLESLELQPGDAILVPEKVVRTNYMRELRDATQILFQIAVTAGVAVALF